MFGSRMGTRRRSLVAVLLAMCLAGAVGVLTAVPAAATLGDRPVITYNLQGATSGNDSKWTTVVAGYARRADIVVLQEAGAAPPPSAPGTAPMVIPAAQLANANAGNLPNIGVANQVTHTQWRSGLANLDVYFLQTDPNTNGATGQQTYRGGRNNLAVVTHQAAAAVAAIPNPAGGRATLGLLFGTTWYFDIHARAGTHGSDAPALINAIRTFVNGRNLGEAWAAIGDFNRDPGTLAPPAGAARAATGLPTQQSGGELDYAVYTTGAAPAVTERLAGASADHYAVGFGPIRAAAEPTQLFTSPSGDPVPEAIENMQAGGVLDVDKQGTANLTPIVSYDRNGGANQSWNVNFYTDTPKQEITFQGTQSGRCIDITNSARNAGSGTTLSLYDCTGQPSQRWVPLYLGNSEYEFQSVFLPDLCMNLSGGQTDSNNKTTAILYPCDNTPNERFVFTPTYTRATSNVPVQTPPSDPIALEAISDGGIIDVSGGATANDSAVISYHRDLLANQGWNVVPNTDESVSFRGVGSGRCLDIHNSTSAVSGRELVIYNCTGQQSQRWEPEPQDNGTTEFVSALDHTLCLDIAGNPQNPDLGHLDVYTCNSQPNQAWFYTPFDPDGAPTADQDGPDDSGVGGDTFENLTVRPPNPGTPAQRIAYYTSWSTYANAFYPKNLATEGIAGRLTVLNYAFENIDPVKLTCFAANKPSVSDPNSVSGNDGSSDAYADYQKEYSAVTSVNGKADTYSQPLRGNFQQLRELKAKYPKLKILVSLGGWTYSKYFSKVAATAASRQKFVSSCINLYIKGNLPKLAPDPAGGTGAAAGIFDGFDLDWEFPGTDLGHVGNFHSPQDGADYVSLLKEFRTQLNAVGGGRHYLTTAVLPAGPADIAQLQPAAMSQYLDFGTVEAYDYHGAFDTHGPTNAQAPLYDSPVSPAAGTGFTVDASVNTLLQNGFPASKMILGVPLYGRGWTGVPGGTTHGLYRSVTGPTAAFKYSAQPGVADYKELKAAGKLTTAHTFFDQTTDSAWIYDGTNFWSVETPQSLAFKRQYISDKGLAGVMLYSLESDDPTATLVKAATGTG
ncbi:glycosyl hydrolase family 18 protein [Streptacidiphilus jiangxiensis]|uniref:chitinase n=1 Tax=Streptacidiphilus jiangxiensis TaxID=235985 RepID=A0A1H7TA25_STRJI|nr:glycosyl hydrolase family 18 protein [Streptacidiphilus jiangxiensis]SEL81548.1 Chitinase, GH18 family [Streptacidiphilus jiangxiensis]